MQIEAKKVNEETIKGIGDSYVLLYDKSHVYTFENLIKAINLFSDCGWTCINMSVATFGERLGEEHVMYALMKRI